MSILNFSTSGGTIPSDVSSFLGKQAISSILKLMRDAYFDLISQNTITNNMDENDITEEWFMHVQSHWRNSGLSLIPIHEKQDKSKSKSRGKPPTIDFCFRSQWDKRTYFGVECKIIEANNNSLCNKYIINGINRYTKGLYSQVCPEGAMAGYIRQTECSDVANQISIRLSSQSNNAGITKSNDLYPFDEYYVSEHLRVDDNSDFTIHHLLLFFKVS